MLVLYGTMLIFWCDKHHIARYAPPRALRSATDAMLVSVPSTTNPCLAASDNAFSVGGPRLWNDLPVSLNPVTNNF